MECPTHLGRRRARRGQRRTRCGQTPDSPWWNAGLTVNAAGHGVVRCTAWTGSGSPMTTTPAATGARSSSCTAGRATATTTAPWYRCSTGRRVLVPDLRGFGDTTAPADADATAYGADGQAAEVIALIEEPVGGPVVLGGYDVGSRTAQGVAKARPDLVRGMVISPPVPGAGPASSARTRSASSGTSPSTGSPCPSSSSTATAPPCAPTSSTSGRTGPVPTTCPSPPSSTASPTLTARPGAFVRSINWYRSGSAAVARALGEKTPTRPTGSPRRRRCSGPSTTRCSRATGRTRSTTGSPPPTCASSTASATSSPLEAPEVFAAAIREH